MSYNMTAHAVQGTKPQLEDFLHRTNNAGLHVAEPSVNGGGNWEFIDDEDIQYEGDKHEWVLVGKTEAEKQEAEVKAKQRMKKRVKRISQH
jgi:hypothetical protein